MQKVIIIGKKNVGKSSLFNLLTKSKKSTNINYCGYTRDSNSTITKLGTNFYEIIDTAGLGYEKSSLDYITLKHTWDIIKKADIIILLDDINEKYTQIDKNIQNIIKNLKQKKIFVTNKIDTIKQIDLTSNNKNTIHISVKKNIGINSLIKKLNEFSSIKISKLNTLKYLTISIVGKTNVGKSSLANKLTNSNRMIIYNKEGTTRDNIEINVIKNKRSYNIIDTPGVKKKKTLKTS